MVGPRRARLTRATDRPEAHAGEPAMATPEHDPRIESLVREAPALKARPLDRRDRLAETALAVALVGVIAAMAVTLPGPGTSTPGLLALLLAVQVLAQRVRFTVGPSTTVPTVLAMVPMLLLLHPAAVPALVVAAGVLSRLPEFLSRRVH